MKLSSLLKGVKTRDVYEERDVERVTDKDNDNLKNSLFVCIDGNNYDSHALAKKAVEKGAVAVLSNRDLAIPQQIIVEDTRSALALIASNFYNNPSKKLKMIGVTGTNGKTSTSFHIQQILNAMGMKCGILGTVINSTGEKDEEPILTTAEPLDLHRMLANMVEAGCEYCVMEVSSQALSQKRVYGLNFCASVLTNITPEHLDYHGCMENYMNAKLTLFNQSDFACVNIDDEINSMALGRIKCKTVTVSAISDWSDYTAKNVLCNENGVRYEFVGMDCISRIQTNLYGRFTVYNSLLAIATLVNLGFDINEITKAVEHITPVCGRAEIVSIPKDFTVMIDYAHTPDGLQNILQCVREMTKGKVILVFGCGGDRDKSKRATMGRIAGEFADFAIVTSDNPRKENPLLIINDILCGMEKSKARIAVIENRQQAIEFALKKAKKNDLVLLAGKGHETYQIIGNDKYSFDERKVIKSFFE